LDKTKSQISFPLLLGLLGEIQHFFLNFEIHLGIIEAREPEASGLSFDKPRVEESDAPMEILDPRPEGL
jgi:hypothetical protein